MKKIVYELNEVPKRLFDFYADAFPSSAFSKLRALSHLYETNTADAGHLSPWITWPTMHRGVSNLEHEISDLGQDLKSVNKEFPSVFNYLANNDLKVGVFGSLQSYPLPENLDNYSFYIPDTFAAGSECFPKRLTDFQSFNLSMVKSSGRNVSKGIAVKEAAKFLLNAKKMGLNWSTAGKLANQVFSEQINSDRLVRRRTSQVEIAFDLFFRQLSDTMPDICFFFTNHVASSMHRYWPTIFPNDYEDGRFDETWRKRWSMEIPHAVKVANFQLSQLMNFCDMKKIELIVCSSMGQQAVQEARPITKEVLITNIKALMKYLSISECDWEPRLSMAPQVVIKPLSENVVKLLDQLDKISINGEKIKFFVTSSGDVRFEIALVEVDALTIYHDGKRISEKDLGVRIVNLQDAAGSYAYHIPQGILLHYIPKNYSAKENSHNWRPVSTLDFCPSLIKSFGIKKPDYMKGDQKLFLQS